MTVFLGLFIAVVMICTMMSTPETRAAGRRMVAPWARRAGWATVAIWAVVLLV